MLCININIQYYIILILLLQDLSAKLDDILRYTDPHIFVIVT